VASYLLYMSSTEVCNTAVNLNGRWGKWHETKIALQLAVLHASSLTFVLTCILFGDCRHPYVDCSHVIEIIDARWSKLRSMTRWPQQSSTCMRMNGFCDLKTRLFRNILVPRHRVKRRLNENHILHIHHRNINGMFHNRSTQTMPDDFRRVYCVICMN